MNAYNIHEESIGIIVALTIIMFGSFGISYNLVAVETPNFLSSGVAASTIDPFLFISPTTASFTFKGSNPLITHAQLAKNEQRSMQKIIRFMHFE